MPRNPSAPIPDPELEPFVSIPRAGASLGVGQSQAYAMAKAGVLPTLAVGPRRRVVPTAELRRLAGLESK